ncbi:MAG: Crp/Fnr family transcriptional regulator [Bacteroidia bacterium]|nr:Crp/Fnr family transcriptional regulator [Bacteroidia bacterium]
MKRLKVKKGQILQRKGERSIYVYQVLSGLLRSYHIDQKGREHIFMFAPEGWIIGDGVMPGTEGDLFIEALEDGTVIQLEKDMETKHDPSKLLKRIGVLQKRVIMLISSSAIERYEHFIETYPNIVQRVPQKMIASYLGITPEALSTVKRQRMQGK